MKYALLLFALMGICPLLHGAVNAPGSCYVAPWGNDNNNGKGFESPKLTVAGCLTVLQSNGGKIFVQDGGGAACTKPVKWSPLANTGMWLIGPNDPNFATPPTGSFAWHVPLTLEGVAGTSYSNANGSGALTCITGASGTDPTKPAMWFSGTNIPIRVKNIRTQYPAQVIRIGIDSNGNRHGDTTDDLVFDNVSGADAQGGGNPSAGPTVDIASNALWIWFKHCSFDGNSAAATQVQGESIYIKADSGQGPGLIFIQDSEVNTGGIEYDTPISTPSLYVMDTVMDGTNGYNNPVVLLNNWTNNAIAVLSNVIAADFPTGVRAVKVVPADSSVTPYEAGNVLVLNSDVDGPAVSLGPRLAASAYANVTTSLVGARAGGLYSGGPGSTPGVRLSAQLDEAKLADVPFTVKLASIISQSGASWAAGSGSATVTQNVTGPDHTTTNAFNLATASGTQSRSLTTASQSVSVGDWVIAAVAVRNANAATSAVSMMQVTATDLGIQFDHPIGNGNFNMFAPIAGDGNWMWSVYAAKVSNAGTGTSTFKVSLSCDATHSYDFFDPMFIYIHNPAASGWTDNEVLEYANALVPHGNTLSVGDVSLGLRGERVSIPMPNSAFFAKFADAPFTADRVFTWPDVTGTVQVTTGSTVLYRCSVAGTLRIGELTTVSGDCGTAVDTGLRIQ